MWPSSAMSVLKALKLPQHLGPDLLKSQLFLVIFRLLRTTAKSQILTFLFAELTALTFSQTLAK